ncbi:hypothetical protein PG985_004563 [Apiospora marii]|uniref:Uncharacterized protein n=1 Tax=Apiospora marii TaxID=335849 RepID=A0ABR1S9P2_9PEZI
MPAELLADIPPDWPLPNPVPHLDTSLEDSDHSNNEIAATPGDLIDEKMGHTPAPLPHTPSQVAAVRRDSWDDDFFKRRQFVDGWDVEAIVAMPHVLYYPVRYGTFMFDDSDIDTRRLKSRSRPVPSLEAHLRAFFALVVLIIIAILLYFFLG